MESLQFDSRQERLLAFQRDKERLAKELPQLQLVLPGHILSTDPAYMRGHGTHQLDEPQPALVAAVAGIVERVNKLVSVHPMQSTSFVGQVGDVLVARVHSVMPKRWRCDVGGRQDAILLLSSINLPGGIQRRKSEADELQMRQFLNQGDVLVAEVQSVYADGALSLHTRNLKYGKLQHGQLVRVPNALVPRSRAHFAQMCGCHVILGLNGFIWIAVDSQDLMNVDSLSVDEIQSLSKNAKVIRLAHCVRALAYCGTLVTQARLTAVHRVSLSHANDDDLSVLLIPSTMKTMVMQAASIVEVEMDTYKE